MPLDLYNRAIATQLFGNQELMPIDCFKTFSQIEVIRWSWALITGKMPQERKDGMKTIHWHPYERLAQLPKLISGNIGAFT